MCSRPSTKFQLAFTLEFFVYVAVYGTASTSAKALCTRRVMVVKRKKSRGKICDVVFPEDEDIIVRAD
jgi:hypothetical protein